MKVAIFSLLFAAFASIVLGLAPQKAVVVTYPQDTPDSVISQAMDAVKAAVRWLLFPLIVQLSCF